MMTKLRDLPREGGDEGGADQDQHQGIAKSRRHLAREPVAPPPAEGIRAVAQKARRGLLGAKTLGSAADLPLQLGLRQLPEWDGV